MKPSSIVATIVFFCSLALGQNTQVFDQIRPMPIPQWQPPTGSCQNPTDVVSYDPSTGLTVTETFADVVRSNSQIPSSGSLSDGKSKGKMQQNFSGLEPIYTTTQYPFCATVKLRMYFPDGEYQATGIFITPRHILTAGHCVYNADKKQWANAIKVIPGYSNGFAPFGEINAVQYHAFTAWMDNRDFDYDIGWIDLGEPVGVTTGWYGYGWNSNNSTIASYYWWSNGYPAEWPYDGETMCGFHGTLDYVYEHTLGINRAAFGGQSGSGLYNGDLMTFGIMSNSDRSNFANFARITEGKFLSISESTAPPSKMTLYARSAALDKIFVNPDQMVTLTYTLFNYSSVSLDAWPDITIWLDDDGVIEPAYDRKLRRTSFTGVAMASYGWTNSSSPLKIPKNVMDRYYNIAITYYDSEEGEYKIIANLPILVQSLGVESSVNEEEVLLQSYPNPATSNINLDFILKEKQYVSVSLHDVYGKEVAVIRKGYLEEGEYQENVNVAGLSNGVYYLRFQNGSQTITNPVAIIR